ncbi:hypothetical protein OCS_05445 [Ophiocordyceps sinensis CO18]|uniref:Uncharacterized protein n=1 Tax=Ophiocordyceps sinensis (strain Co18 / CGMCC 3.14243) TaxID=911162 RepID=T5A8C9_OPHSC|nr:hypothetical protein OCS_05445 [Ophiocordyceps sinensis CO18]
MPTIPVYSASPITASKATGVTPLTQGPEDSRGNHEQLETIPGAAVASTTSIPGWQHSAGLGPGAGPSLPVQTGMPQPNPYAPAHSSPMANMVPSRVGHISPPAPQPGAVPMPPGRERQIPPPPKAGESAAAERQAQAAIMAPPRLPPQMAYHAPAAMQPIQGRSSTEGLLPRSGVEVCAKLLQGASPSAGYSNPPGYQQDTDASGFNRYQGEGHSFGGSQNSSNWPSAGGENQAGVWDTARKWATAAGESLAAAESQVWKKINKG